MLNDLQRRFSTQHIISTLFQMVATLFQHCYAALRKKSSLCESSRVTYLNGAVFAFFMAPKERLSTNYTVYHAHFHRTACGPSVFSLQLKTSRPIFLTQMHTLMRAVQNQYKQAGSYKVNKQLSGKIVQRARFFNT